MYVSYDFYKQTFGGAIPEADFSKVEAKAEAVIGYLTYINGDIFAKEDNRVKLAVCAAAEELRCISPAVGSIMRISLEAIRCSSSVCSR